MADITFNIYAAASNVRLLKCIELIYLIKNQSITLREYEKIT